MLLVANGSVFTRNAQTPFIPNGAVAIDGDTIVEVGPECELKAKYPDAEYVDAQGNLIMPGLVNCHTHIYSGLARGLAIKGCNPTNFLENLEQQWWKIDDNLTLDGTKASAYATILDSIRDGVIQRFEFCVELAWKTLREYLLDQGYTEINSPKSVMKQAFADGILDHEDGWLQLLDARNETSHIYDEATATTVFGNIRTIYVPLLKDLIQKLGEVK